MEPRSAASEVAKLIKTLSRARKLPEPWRPEHLNNLIGQYRRLVKEIQGAQKGGGARSPDPDMQEGKSGAYEEMCWRAEQAEKGN